MTGQVSEPVAQPPPVPRVEPAPRGSAVDWIMVVWITLLGGWAGVLALAFLPQYVGAVPFPISALLAVGAMIIAPRLCYRLTGSMAAALLPVLVWFGLTVWVVLSRNGIMPTRPLTVSAGQWRVMVLLGLGSLSAAASIGLLWGDRLRDRLTAQRPPTSPVDGNVDPAAAPPAAG